MKTEYRTANWKKVRAMPFVKKIVDVATGKTKPPRSSVLFCLENDLGTGSLARAMAIAACLKAVDGCRDIVFFGDESSMSLACAAGFAAHYLCSIEECDEEQQNNLARAAVLNIFRDYSVELVILDGSARYPAFMGALDERPDIARIRIERGQPSATCAALAEREYVVRSREAGFAAVPFDGTSMTVDPILSFDPQSLSTRDSARQRLGLTEEAIAVWVRAGADEMVDAIAVLDAFPAILTVVTPSPDPLLLSGFDFAIAGADYDSAHELLACGLPAIVVPQDLPDALEEVGRANRLEKEGAAIPVRFCGDRGAFRRSLADVVARLCNNPDLRARMSECARRLLPTTGTHDAAIFAARVRPGGGGVAELCAPVSSPLIDGLDELRRLSTTDEPELTFVARLVRPGTVAIDVGGNIGLYALHMAEAGASVKVIECRPDAVIQLRRLFAGSDVEVHAIAASDRDGFASLFLPVEERSLLGSRASLAERANGDVVQLSYRVRMRRLDDLDLARVALIKIDVEGHEAAVVRGAVGLIDRDRPVLLIEIEDRHHPGNSEHIFALIGEHGYRPWYLHRGKLHSAASFDFARFQRPGSAKKAGGARHPDYINNFLFLPVEREQAILSDLRAAALATARR